MEYYYRVYDFFMRLTWGSLLYLPMSIAVGMGVYLCTGEMSYACVAWFAVVMLRGAWVNIRRATLLCPHCGRHSLILMPVLWDIFHAAYRVREYKVYCWRCKHSYQTDLSICRRARDFFPYIRTRGEPPPDAFTKQHALNTLLITIAASLILLAISYRVWV